MINLSFKNKGGDSGDRTPSLNVSDLLKSGLLGKKEKLKQGDSFNVKMVNSGGIVSEAEFYVNRKDATTLKARGWNEYLFPLPTNGRDLSIGVCEFGRVGARKASQTASQAAQSSDLSTDRSAYAGLSALNKLVAAKGTKVAAAEFLGVSVDTLRRMFKKAEELDAKSRKAAKTISKKPTTSGRYGSQKKASAPKSSGPTFTNRYGEKVTIAQLKKVLKETGGVKAAAADYLNTNPRTLGRWLEAAGLA